MLYNLYACLENQVLNEAINFYRKETKKKLKLKCLMVLFVRKIRISILMN